VRGAGVATLSPPSLAESERVSHDLARALSAGNLDTAAACFARDACLITPDGTAVHGRERIRSVLAQLVLARAQVAVELSSTLVAGGIALTRERWTIRSPGADGRALVRRTEPMLVLRWIEEEWKLALAAPWGWS